MKLTFMLLTSLIIFSGCSSKNEVSILLNKNAKQTQLIRQQQAQIDALKKSISTQALKRKRARRVRQTLPPPPKKDIKLRKVEDNNYSSGYMYPKTSKASPKKSSQASNQPSVTTEMSKEECISMIGQEKFDKYTQMFGNEGASLKRCKMLKAMKQ